METVAQTVGIVGLGYVGLPLALAFCDSGSKVIGVDIDENKVATLREGASFLGHISGAKIKEEIDSGRLAVSHSFETLSQCDSIILCVPTPLTAHREPDLRHIQHSASMVGPFVRAGQVISLESTTYPGTTRQILLPILEKHSSLRAGADFSMVYSPEREDPGNPKFEARNTPKIVSGLTATCCKKGVALYSQIVDQVVEVSNLETAETTKLLENIFRSVNIALVNELKVLCHRFEEKEMDINIFEVIEAASTKPFGYMPFRPGPGLGGHCIPIDPFYLTWKAREVDFTTRFIELAGEINANMPYYVTDRVNAALSSCQKSINGSKILVVGVAYKDDVEDTRESPALRIISILQKKGALVSYHDPHVPVLSKKMESQDLSEQNLSSSDAVLIVTAHKNVNYEKIAQCAGLVVDARGIMRKLHLKPNRIVEA